MKLKKKSESDEYVIEQDRLFRKHGNNFLLVPVACHLMFG